MEQVFEYIAENGSRADFRDQVTEFKLDWILLKQRAS